MYVLRDWKENSVLRIGFRQFLSSNRLDGELGVTKIKVECPKRGEELGVLYLLRDWKANLVLPKLKVNVCKAKRN